MQAKPAGRHRDDIDRDLKAFGDECDPAGPAAVTFAMVEGFVQACRGKGDVPRTVNHKLEVLRHALNMAVRRRYVRQNPMQGFTFERAEETVPEVLTDDAIGRLLKAFRSTAGSNAAAAFDEGKTADFLGHSNPKLPRKHYIRRAFEEKRQIAETLAARVRSAFRSAYRGLGVFSEVATMTAVRVSYTRFKVYDLSRS